MPFLILFALSWSAFAVFADKSRWRQFLPAAMLAMLMSFSSDVLMYSYPLWVYHDGTGLLTTVLIHLLDDWGIYPVTTYLFMQYFPAQKSLRSKVLYFVAWTTGVILLEALFCRMGWMKHQMWWSLFCSYIADWVIFYTLLYFHRLYNRPLHRDENNAQPKHVPFFHASALSAQLKTNLTLCKDRIRSLGLELYPLLEQPDLKIMLFEIPIGTRVPNHFVEDDKCCLLLQGEIELIIDSTPYHLGPGQLVHIARNKAHSVHSIGHEPALLLSIFLPFDFHSTSHALSF